MLVAVFPPTERVVFFEDKVIFTGFSSCQHLQTESFRPAVQTNQQARLVPFDLRVDNTFLVCQMVQNGAHNDPCLLRRHDHMTAIFDCPFGNGSSSPRLTCSFDHHIESRQPISCDICHHHRRRLDAAVPDRIFHARFVFIADDIDLDLIDIP